MQSNKIFFRGSFWFWEKPMVNKVNIPLSTGFSFSPRTLGFHDPIWLSHIFQRGWWKTTNSQRKPSIFSTNQSWIHQSHGEPWKKGPLVGCSFRVPGRARFSSCTPHRKRRFSGILNIVSQGFGNTCVQGPTLSIRTTGSSVFVFVTAVRHV